MGLKKKEGAMNAREKVESVEREMVSSIEIESARRICLRDIKEHLSGPFLSFVLHIFVLVFFGSLIVIKPPEERKELLIDVVNMPVREMKRELPEPPPQPDPEETVERDTEIASEAPENPVVAVDTPEVMTSDTQPPAPRINITDSVFKMPVGLPLPMQNRKGPAKDKIVRDKGLQGTEKSVVRALNWLRDHQNPDGSWGDQRHSKAFLTSVALMTFLAHGETPVSQDYGMCILKAAERLMAMVEGRGSSGLVAEDRNTYGHPAVAYALGETFALTRMPRVGSAMEAMVRTLVCGQNSLGGYNYGHNNKPSSPDPADRKAVSGVPRFDLSVSGWHYQALKAGFIAGSETAGLEKSMDAALSGLKREMFSGGGFKYCNLNKSESPSPTMTAVGLLCMQMLGSPDGAEAKKALRWMEEFKGGELLECRWRDIDKYSNGGTKSWPLYQWYYQTQALFQATGGEGSLWTRWDKEFRRTFLREQAEDGHWTSPADSYARKGSSGHGERSSGEGAPFSKLDLDIYSTSLCGLTLQVYFRYLPTFKIASAPPKEKRRGASTEGLLIE